MMNENEYEIPDENTNALTGQMTSDSIFMNMAKFSEIIERIVVEENINHMEAVLWFCDKNDMEVSEVSQFISELLKQKIKMNAMENGFLPKENQLPL